MLRETHREFIVSKQKIKKAEGICLIREKRENATQTLGFTARPFVLCGLPIRRPPANQLLFERSNGHFTLQITGHPEFGLPFGQDRLIPIFLATMAARQQSRIVRFESAAELLDTFGLSKGGKEYRRLVSAFERIFGATIFFGTELNRFAAKVAAQSLWDASMAYLIAEVRHSRSSGTLPARRQVAGHHDRFAQVVPGMERRTDG